MWKDDNDLTAHQGLLGKPLTVFNAAVALQDNSFYTAMDLNVDYGTQCYRTGECIDLSQPGTIVLRCGPGEANIGFDRSDCRGSWARPICCNAATAPDQCTWRGGGLDCNGQCHGGEVTLFYSKKGGGPDSESGEKKCNRGNKAFCCVDDSFRENFAGCHWASWCVLSIFKLLFAFTPGYPVGYRTC